LLTTPKPETALSLMKSYNVSYLLIDSTDLGKYPAYSIIGSDENEDRYSQIPVMVADSGRSVRGNEEEIIFYTGGVLVDEDIVYNNGNQSIELEFNRDGMIGSVVKVIKNEGISFEQPHAVFVRDKQQIYIPVRYLYFQGEVLDFGGGLDAVIMVIPSASNNVDVTGAAIYLSPKVSKSLFAQLYLLDDYFENYKTVKLAHSEEDFVVKSLRSQGVNAGEFVYYQGFRGPIKIWEVNYPENVIEREEFLKMTGEYAELDDLDFVK
jgi:hypothetical protein